MKRPLLTLLPLLAVAAFSCNKNVKDAPAPTHSNAVTTGTPSLGNMARYSGAGYSQSISLEKANNMIGSYLASVKYPAQDTAIRSFAFDADTLRAYLANPKIKTIRFHMAHSPSQTQEASGKYMGLTPAALTLVIAGYSEEDILIRNNLNGVYDYCYPCPTLCNQGNGLLQ